MPAEADGRSGRKGPRHEAQEVSRWGRVGSGLVRWRVRGHGRGEHLRPERHTSRQERSGRGRAASRRGDGHAGRACGSGPVVTSRAGWVRSDGAQPASSGPTPTAGREVKGSEMKVLLVEDEPILARAIRNGLERAGLTVDV